MDLRGCPVDNPTNIAGFIRAIVLIVVVFRRILVIFFVAFFSFISNLCFIYRYTLSTNLFYLILCVKFLEIIVLWTILLSNSWINFIIIMSYHSLPYTVTIGGTLGPIHMYSHNMMQVFATTLFSWKLLVILPATVCLDSPHLYVVNSFFTWKCRDMQGQLRSSVSIAHSYLRPAVPAV